MADKLIVSFEEYIKIVEKLAIEIHNNYKPTVLVGIMRGAAPIIDILSRILKLPIAYIVIQSYTGKGQEDQQGELMFAREISSLAKDEDFKKIMLSGDGEDGKDVTIDDLIECPICLNVVDDHHTFVSCVLCGDKYHEKCLASSEHGTFHEDDTWECDDYPNCKPSEKCYCNIMKQKDEIDEIDELCMNAKAFHLDSEEDSCIEEGEGHDRGNDGHLGMQEGVQDVAV